MKKDEEVRRLYALLRHYDQREVAEVGARVRRFCTTVRPEDAEEQSLGITLAVLRHRDPGHRDDERQRDSIMAALDVRARHEGDDA